MINSDSDLIEEIRRLHALLKEYSALIGGIASRAGRSEAEIMSVARKIDDALAARMNCVAIPAVLMTACVLVGRLLTEIETRRRMVSN
jgi:hypothetical protein